MTHVCSAIIEINSFWVLEEKEMKMAPNSMQLMNSALYKHGLAMKPLIA